MLQNKTKRRCSGRFILSGGMNSGLVAASVSKLGFKDVIAHTVRFKNSPKDECFLAQKTADYLGLK